ncbi:hypothetical protein ACFPVX_00040 [Cohnella faecalis]|uniref:hypothetical protein n=1 Tax=Cohnella faecalis TaxID=2315694 RepID=UPI0011C23D8F|nr:hypothetical protein [Cohnella faecalis]
MERWEPQSYSPQSEKSDYTTANGQAVLADVRTEELTSWGWATELADVRTEEITGGGWAT